MENEAVYTNDDTYIVVINPSNENMHVTVSHINSSAILFPGKAEVVFCPVEVCHTFGTGIHNTGIYVQSNGSVAVEGINRIQSSTDSFLVRPTYLLSREYLVVTYCQATLACQIGVVSTTDGTSLVMYFPFSVDLIMENGELGTYGPNKNMVVDLKAHYVYQLQSSSDLTGVIVTSNNPVACFAGANQTMPLTEGKEDHLVGALPPTQAWGYDYVIVGIDSTNYQDVVKIIATEDNTIVNISGCTQKTIILNRVFDFIEDSFTCGGYVLSSNFKIVVAHIRIKDNPGMYFPFPTNLLSHSYTVYVPHNHVGAHTSMVLLYIKTNDISNIIFNGTLLNNNGWTEIASTDWSYRSVSVDNGLLFISSSSNTPFGGHLIVRNTYKLAVMNLIPLPYNEGQPTCCEHLELRISDLTTTEGSGLHGEETTNIDTTTHVFKTTVVSPTTSPTAEPTTVVPTTAEPTTSETMTAVSTTAEPTTVVPTTAQPTTAVPTTAQQTTVVPTTAQPTTVVPTTAQPTTVVPTTAQPTTVVPTTAQPTTVVPTTAQPTTVVPTTAQQTTVVPTTAQPTTAVSTTAYTTTAAQTGQKEDCCFCSNSLNKTTYRTWTEKELREMTIINKKNTSNAIRKLTSASDDRMSAIGLGYCGIAVLCTVFASVLAIDLSMCLCKSSKVSPKK
ncbi:uncharacterized protein [Argopecten irradians]|uniref:uncharacterized protein n=1 Tax=Argopecten irradians TaxID=31199 RepID=UPI00371968E7